MREGGSLPAIVEADDLGLYVVKFRGAGQGRLALVAEVICGEIGRALGLRVPELVFVEVDSALGRNEPDYEIRQLLQASAGLNVGLDYLPGSVMFDPAARDAVTVEEASMAVWFDAFTMNVDRTAKNANLLLWHRKLYLIDHGAALYFHHDWANRMTKAEAPFKDIAQHVLLRWARKIAEAGATARAKLTQDVVRAIVHEVPEEWLEDAAAGISANDRRIGYLEFFCKRLESAQMFEQEAMDAHARLI